MITARRKLDERTIFIYDVDRGLDLDAAGRLTIRDSTFQQVRARDGLIQLTSSGEGHTPNLTFLMGHEARKKELETTEPVFEGDLHLGRRLAIMWNVEERMPLGAVLPVNAEFHYHLTVYVDGYDIPSYLEKLVDTRERVPEIINHERWRLYFQVI